MPLKNTAVKVKTSLAFLVPEKLLFWRCIEKKTVDFSTSEFAFLYHHVSPSLVTLGFQINWSTNWKQVCLSPFMKSLEIHDLPASIITGLKNWYFLSLIVFSLQKQINFLVHLLLSLSEISLDDRGGEHKRIRWWGMMCDKGQQHCGYESTLLLLLLS